jgi:hypothetical protein
VSSAGPGWDSKRYFPTHCPKLAKILYGQSQINIRKALIDGCFAPAKKDLDVDKTKPGYSKILVTANDSGLPGAAHAESASSFELKLVEAIIDTSFTRYTSDKLII